MLVDVSNELKQLNGQPLMDNVNGEAVVVTFKDVIANALLSPVQKEQRVDKIRKYELAKKVYDGGKVDLNEEEIKLIKDRVGDVYPPIVVGPVFELLKV